MRASAVCEQAGIPSVTLISEGFIVQAGTVSMGLGLPDMPVAVVPGHPGVQTADELRRNVLSFTAAQVLDGLTRQRDETGNAKEYEPREVVFTGSFDAVNDYFYTREWSDGLPVVPPTQRRVEAFLLFTDRDPDEVLGVVLPDNRSATPWNVAVNGVMAGCRPEYMPVLVALAEAMCDADYGVEHSGNTPGAETLIVLNGPIARQLGFNFEQGVMRDGFRANTSIGRFWRLYLRNLAGFLPHKNDKATFGNTWRVVVPENDAVLTRIGWTTLAQDAGLAAGANAVTVARYTGGDLIIDCNGDTPEAMLPYIADAVAKQNRWQLVFTIGMAHGKLRPLLLLGPILAETIARAGWSKNDVKAWLYRHARIPADRFQFYLDHVRGSGTVDIRDEVRAGRAPPEFHATDDPARLVPLVHRPEDFMIAVTGDPLRTNAYTFAHNGTFGFPVTKEIRLPRDWDRLLAGGDG